MHVRLLKSFSLSRIFTTTFRKEHSLAVFYQCFFKLPYDTLVVVVTDCLRQQSLNEEYPRPIVLSLPTIIIS